jgi:hypothetical protein
MADELNIDVFKSVLGLMFDVNAPENQAWINAAFNWSKPKVDNGVDMSLIPDMLLKSDAAKEPAMAPFYNRFSSMINANKRAQERNTEVPYTTISEYVQSERDFQKAVRGRAGFEEFASMDNIKKFIDTDLSVQEVTDRIDNAFYAVRTADETLKNEIKKMFPSANDSDLAKALITGNTDALTGAQKIGEANIMAAATTIGYGGIASNVSELQKQGVTRETALKGFQQVSRERSGIQQASRMFGEQGPTQKELEAEALTGTESASAKRLRSQARAQFGGQTGITTGSLGRKKQV